MGQAGDRLPWLSDEPAPARAGSPARANADRPAGSRTMWPLYLLLLLLVAAVAGGAWWLGTRQREAPAPQLPAEQPHAVPLTEAEPVAGPITTVPAETSDLQPAAPDGRSAEPRRRGADERRSPPALVAEDGPGTAGEAATPEEGFGRSVFPADEPVVAAPPVTGPRPVVVYHPQKNRGRVVQLGAFPTRAQAEETWKRVTRRYPYLASKPKMVNTVEVRAIGSGRGTRMYRLQLGTSSQAQSAVICQQLERAGQSCVVVY